MLIVNEYPPNWIYWDKLPIVPSNQPNEYSIERMSDVACPRVHHVMHKFMSYKSADRQCVCWARLKRSANYIHVNNKSDMTEMETAGNSFTSM